MKQTNAQLLKKFNQISRWMIEDTERAMFDARANFLTAQGLVIYIEILGSFVTGRGEKNSGGNFDAFFARMGRPYKLLLSRHNRRRIGSSSHVVYDDLRCGLVHEYAVKRKGFVVVNSGRMSEAQILLMKYKDMGFEGKSLKVDAGIVFGKNVNSKDYWVIIDPVLWLDFKIAVEQYSQELSNEKNKDLRKNFFKRARQINLKNFN